MAAAGNVAVVLEKVGAKAVEVTKNSIENAARAGEAVMSKLEDIKNLTPEQLRERMDETIDEYKKNAENTVSKIEDTLEKGKSEINDASSERIEKQDTQELSEEEINGKQKAAIKEAFERIKSGEKLTTDEVGNLGEMMMDQYYISQGYTPLNKHRVTSLNDSKEGFKTGIDGVYEKTNPDGTKSYVIADAKYNNSVQKMTKDGLQLSDNWIDKRLDDAVGKEKADEIRDAAEDDPDSVKHELYHIDPRDDGSGYVYTDTHEVDSEGHKIGDKTVVERFDADGNPIENTSDKQDGGDNDER